MFETLFSHQTSVLAKRLGSSLSWRPNLKSNLALSICFSLLLSLASLGTAQFAQNNPSADLFPMVDGTQVQILSSNFLTVIASGQIMQGRLELQARLIPTQDVQLLFSNAQTGEVGILPAIVSFEGNDLLLPVQMNTNAPHPAALSYISLRNWLFTTKGITLTTASDMQ